MKQSKLLSADEMAAHGGMLRTGVYNLDIDTRDIAGRASIAAELFLSEPFLQELYNFDPAAIDVLANIRDHVPAQVLFQAAGETADHVRPALHLKAQYFASGAVWDNMMVQPEWAEMFDMYVTQLSSRFDLEDENYGQVTDFAESMDDIWRRLGENFLPNLSAEEAAGIVQYLHVGTANQDYRSMMLDGEVMVIVAGWNSLHGLLDFIFLMGNSEWVSSEEELQVWLPEQSNFKRKVARWVRIML